MGVFDGLGEQIVKNKGHVDDAIEKGGDFIDSKTGSKHAEYVDKGQDFLRDKVGTFGEGTEAPRQDL
ncbi:antitoxin [Tessaracoccus sp.]